MAQLAVHKKILRQDIAAPAKPDKRLVVEWNTVLHSCMQSVVRSNRMLLVVPSIVLGWHS